MRTHLAINVQPVVYAGKADDVAESLGVSGHLPWLNAIYWQQWPSVRNAMIELDARYYRTDGGTSDGYTQSYLTPHMQELYEAIGAKALILVDERDASNVLIPNTADNTLLSWYQNNACPYIYGFEGPNEYNWQAASGNWPNELRSYQTEIYNYVKANPAMFNGISVVGPSIVSWIGWTADVTTLGDLTGVIDVGNSHKYVYNSTAIDSVTDAWHQLTQPVSGNLPLIYTETGYPTNRQARPDFAVSWKAQAKYAPRNFLDTYRVNPGGKMFYYELVDQLIVSDGFYRYGIVDENFVRKPAFYALKNTKKIFDDRDNNSFTPGMLSYDLTGNTTNLHQVLVQKKSGRFYLALWQAISSYDTANGVDIDPAPANVTLTLAAPANFNIYEPTPVGQYSDPNDGALPRQNFTGVSSINLQIPDHVVIVEIGDLS